MSIDVAREYLIGTLLPEDFQLAIGGNHQEIRKDTLQCLYKTSTSHSTIWKWLKNCGVRYKPRTQRFFVDTHETLPNHKYQIDWTVCYLTRGMLNAPMLPNEPIRCVKTWKWEITITWKMIQIPKWWRIRNGGDICGWNTRQHTTYQYKQDLCEESQRFGLTQEGRQFKRPKNLKLATTYLCH